MLTKLHRLITNGDYGGAGGSGGGGGDEAEECYYTVDFENVARLSDCNESAEILELVTSCNTSVFDTEDSGGLGYTDSDGKVKLTVRVHGKSFFDGHELVRLMNRCASPVFGGEYSEEYFLYDSTYPKKCTVVSSNHAILDSTLCYMRMVADIDGEYSGEAMKSGLAIMTSAGIKRELVATNVTTGPTEFSATIPAGYFYDEIIHSPVSGTPVLRVRYDSVMLAEDISDYEPYDGYTVDFEIGSPLLSLGDACDSIDLLNGIIYRTIENKLIDEQTEIREVNYCGYRCFALHAPENASDVAAIGQISSCYIDDLEMMDEGIVVSDDCMTLYVYLGEETTLEEARARLIGQRLLYILELVREEQTPESLGSELGEGTRYIEICSQRQAMSYITYKQTE